MSFWVYILRYADNSDCTGHTDSLEQHIAQHHQGYFPTCYSYKRRPLELVFSQDFVTREEILASEQQLKIWSRKKKEAMMCDDWVEVSRLAKSPASVRPERVEGQCGSTVRQAHSSPRTDDGGAI